MLDATSCGSIHLKSLSVSTEYDLDDPRFDVQSPESELLYNRVTEDQETTLPQVEGNTEETALSWDSKEAQDWWYNMCIIHLSITKWSKLIDENNYCTAFLLFHSGPLFQQQFMPTHCPQCLGANTSVIIIQAVLRSDLLGHNVLWMNQQQMVSIGPTCRGSKETHSVLFRAYSDMAYVWYILFIAPTGDESSSGIDKVRNVCNSMLINCQRTQSRLPPVWSHMLQLRAS